jgi:Tfp pilus assembly protein PilO
MTSNSRKVMFFILLLGITYGAYRYMIKPANSDLAEKKAQIEKNLAKLAEFEKATVATKDLSKQLEQLQGAIEFFESKLPPKSEIHKVLEQVTVIAQKQGLKPKTIRTLNKKDNSGTRSLAPRRGGTNAEQSKSGGRYIEQPLKMELVGNFNSFYSFLLELEKLPRIMKIRELKLEKQTRNNGQIAADFVLSVFCQHG